MLSTLPADDNKGDTVVSVSDGRGEDVCDGDGADDMTWHNEVGDGDDDLGLKTWASAFRGLEPIGSWGAVGQTAPVPQHLYPRASVFSGYSYLYPWAGGSQNALEQSQKAGQPPDRGAPYNPPAYSYALSTSFWLPMGQTPHVFSILFQT